MSEKNGVLSESLEDYLEIILSLEKKNLIRNLDSYQSKIMIFQNRDILK